MDDPPERGLRSRDPAGLCPRCVHVKRIENDRGSVFYLCKRATADPGLPRYPQQPMLRCRGFEE